MPQEISGAARAGNNLVPSHPGLQLLSEVTRALSAGVFSESAIESVVGLLRRGLGAAPCRLWVRDEDGKAYRAYAEPGDAPTAAQIAAMSDAIATATAEAPSDGWDRLELRVPLN